VSTRIQTPQSVHKVSGNVAPPLMVVDKALG